MAAIPHPSSRVDARSAALAGIGFMVVGTLLFALNDTLGKWLVATYAIGQVLALRSIAGMALLSPFIRREGVGAVLKPPRLWIHVLRVICATIEIGCFYWAVTLLPLADVMTYYLAGPIYVTAMSALFLRERVGWRRWTAVLVGFAGVLVALGPGAGTASLPALIAIAGSFSYAVLMLATRSVASASGTTLITWQTLGAFGLGLALLPFGWVTPSAVDLGLMALLGIVAMAGHVCVNRSLAKAPASVVVPFQYTLIIWVVLFGYLAFGDVPGPHLIAGATLIVGSGLFIFLRESARGVPAETTALPPE